MNIISYIQKKNQCACTRLRLCVINETAIDEWECRANIRSDEEMISKNMEKGGEEKNTHIHHNGLTESVSKRKSSTSIVAIRWRRSK